MDIRKTISKISWAYIVFLLLAGVGQGAASVLLYVMVLGGVMNTNARLLISYASMYLVAFPVFAAMMRRIPAWSKEPVEELSPRELFIWLVFSLGLTYLGNYAAQLLLYLMGKEIAVSPVDTMIREVEPWLMVLVTVIIAPVMEELMFRKMLLERIVWLGQWRAMVLSGLFFGLFHGNVNQLFYAVLLGMVFAYLYTKTGRLRYCIFLHMVINLFGGVLPMLLLHINDTAKQTAATLFLLVFQFCCLLGAVVAGVRFVKKQKLFPELVRLPDTSVWRRVFAAPGMLTFLILQGIEIAVMLFT